MGQSVILYTAKLCGDCRKIEQFMEEHNIAYELRDIHADPAHGEELKEGTGMLGVPYLRMGETWMRGYEVGEPFTEEFARFEKWLQTEGLGEIEIDQSELTYVNHIFEGDGWSTGDEIGNVLTLWSGSVHEDYLQHDPEDVRFATRYVMPVAEKPMGRLYIQAETARRISDDRRLIKLSLIGRGPPIGEATEGAMTMMDQAHEWIVRGFTAITSAEMHQRWERTQ